MQHGGGGVHLGQDEVLGDLHRQDVGAQAVVGQAVVEGSRQVGVTQERREQVDRHGNGRAEACPVGGVAERPVDNEVGHGSHESVLADQRQEGVGTKCAEGGMRPTQQRFDAGQVSGRQIDLGLVDDFEGAVVDGGAQFTEQPNLSGSFTSGAVGMFGPFDCVGVRQHHVVVERVDLCHPGSLRGVHRDVRVLHQGFRVEVGLSG